MKIGLLGGSFNPIHDGHLHVAKTAYKKLGLDEVWFLPAVLSPFKDGHNTEFHDRAMMVYLAIKPYRHFRLSMIELENTVPSYSINTARLLRKKCPQDQFYWIIGSDNLATLDNWKDIDELKKLVRFVCVDRGEMQQREDVICISAPVNTASSTDVRNGNYAHVPKPVRRYIREHGLYQ